ncbi:MAG TPA: gamma-glutamyltransferase [Bacteroidales bacterium]
MKNIFFSKIILFGIALAFLIPAYSFSQTYARNGMVASSSMVASEVGRDIMQKGGNAVDAAVATAFALAVTWPSAGNIGGGGFLVLMNENGETTTIDFREKAPFAASEDMFLDKNGKIKDDSNHDGILAVGVPGTVAGLFMAQQKYGKLSWAEVVQPAIDLAKNGFPFTWALHFDSKYFKEKCHVSNPEMANYLLDENGELIEPGNLWKQPELAATLERIRDGGRDGFYKGKTAEIFVDYFQKNGGLITAADLESYDAIERKPIKGNYRGYDIYSMPPPSSGGVALVEMLNMMENYNTDSLEYHSAAYFHVLAEVMHRAYADRAEYLGDPDFNPDMPLDNLLSKEYAKKLCSTIKPNQASTSDSSHFGQMYEGNNTTHISVLDGKGNAVSLTYTLEYSYGSELVVEELGFILNNEMGDFNPVPGVTNRQGQIGTKPNLVASEKRMLSSMTPTIVAKDGKPFLVIGSPGGRTIINSVFQTVLNVLDEKMDIATAIQSGKIHHQWLPDKIRYEKWAISPDTQKLLLEMGYTLSEVENIGSLMGITFDNETGIMEGAADSSSPDGGVAGY